ncbi:hypothetical protein LTSEURB_6695 [Salmonella enterica subsp. enterica serovar Urbana str. R8-2977]|uniref:Uncharacterized protein n=1 Tax=Salmonella enterica subsp. enterica serovar Urbana str. R8-2977 TaxID=913084 RepID=G5S5B3_SALET|nr:hypothetical protein LTSEURB_6695 [Salmonella enterica subsp. enterica serovar Urbana str. R8-2977]
MQARKKHDYAQKTCLYFYIIKHILSHLMFFNPLLTQWLLSAGGG